MFTFIRKIRRSLISSGATKKYLLYAFGEIILVILGILIALGINNANQTRLNERKVDRLLQNVLSELEEGVVASDETIEFLQKKDSLINQVLSDEFKIEDYRRIPELLSLITNFQSLELPDIGYENLTQGVSTIPDLYEEVLTNLRQLYREEKVSVMTTNEILEDQVWKTLESWSENHSWFNQYHTFRDPSGAIEYFVSNSKYKNEVALFQIVLLNHLSNARRFKHFAIENYISIADHLHPGQELPPFINSYMIVLPTETLMDYVGTYIMDPFGFYTEISMDDDKLFFKGHWMQKAEPVFFKSESDFFTLYGDYTGAILFGEQDTIVGAEVMTNGRSITLNKK